MATYNVRFYDTDPWGLIPTGTGSTFTWTGSEIAAGRATVYDTETGIEGTTLDDDSAGGETATADVTVGGVTSTGTTVDAERAWTVRDTVTGDIFQIVEFDVELGAARGDYTLSEMPLVPGRSYEIVNYDSNPDVTAGDPAFSSTDYVASDNVVTGTAGDDTIDATYTGDPEGDMVDSGFGTGTAGMGDVVEGLGGNDTISAGAGDDTIYGGSGQDTIDGGAGDDTIYGDDAVVGTSAAESLNWSAEGADGTSLAGGFTQTSGDVDINVSFTNDGNNAPTYQVETSDTIYTEAGEPMSANSSLYLFGTGDAATSTTTIDFGSNTGGIDDQVENLQFRISDIDAFAGNHIDVVTVNAFDASGNPVAVTLTPAGNDTVAGNTITAAMTLDTPADAAGSVLVEIAGPVASVSISYSNAETPSGGYTGTHGINVSDLHFDTIATVGGDDVITGGLGADTVYGGAGDDTITVAEGDTVFGGDGDDTFTLTDLGEAGSAAINITGGEGGETAGDTLDFQGLIGFKDITYTNTDDAAGGLSGFASLADGSVVTFSEIENIIICFTEGTHILTPRGERRVEDLAVGDLVLTADNGLRPIRWIGRRTVAATGKLAPVRIREGMFNNTRDLLVSPQHRMLLSGWQAELLFGEREVLVPAVHLLNDQTVTQQAGGSVTYVHIAFDQHEVVFAEGARSESFHPGHVGLQGVLGECREELFTIFPELRADPNSYGPAARRSLKKHEAAALCAL